MNSTSVLFDDLGPRGRRRVRAASILVVVLVGVLIGVGLNRLADRGQFADALWEPLTDLKVIEFLLKGFANTLKAAGLAMCVSVVAAAFLALGRLAHNRPVRWLAGAYVEVFRAFPLLLLIFFAFLALPQLLENSPLSGLLGNDGDANLSPFAALVLGLILYNSAMLAELFRAGILSLDRGQREAASSIGLTYWQSMASVIAPQALRRMLPGIISQVVALLKDTALGYIVVYEELLRRARISGEFYRNPLQMFLAAALIYFVFNFALSQFAAKLEMRQRHRFKAQPMDIASGSEDLAANAALARN